MDAAPDAAFVLLESAVRDLHLGLPVDAQVDVEAQQLGIVPGGSLEIDDPAQAVRLKEAEILSLLAPAPGLEDLGVEPGQQFLCSGKASPDPAVLGIDSQMQHELPSLRKRLQGIVGPSGHAVRRLPQGTRRNQREVRFP